MEEQEKPLAPLALTSRSDAPKEALSRGSKRPYSQKCIICCGFIAAFLVILSITFIILALTIFDIRNPTVMMESTSFIQRLEVANGTLRTNRNATLSVQVSVKNPNFSSFKFENASTVIYSGEVVIGEGRRRLAGKVPARQTVQINFTVDIVSKDLASVPGFKEELSKGEFSISSYTRTNGKLKMLRVFKKHVVVTVNCAMKYKFSSQAFEEESCIGHVGT